MRARLSAPNIVLALLCAMYLILYIDRVNVATAAPLIQRELGLSNTQLGLAFAAFPFAYTIFQLLGGMIGDRFGARRTLSVSLLIVCAATAVTGAVEGLISLMLARIALGCGEGSALPTATQAMTRWTETSRWGFAQGITHSFARLGNFITPPIVAALIVALSWRASFFILAGISLVWMVAWYVYFRDSPIEHPGITADDLASLPKPRTREENTLPWLRLFRRILPATLVNFCYGWTLWLFLSWIPSFFVQNYHLDLSRSALFSSGVFLGGVVGDTLGGWVSDAIFNRTKNLVLARRSVIVVGFIGSGIFLVPVIVVHDLMISAICLSLAFFFAELIVAPSWAVAMDIAPRHAGTASGMMNFGSAFAGIVSPVAFGWVVDITGTWTIPFLASILLLLLGAALAFTLHPDRPFSEEGAARAPPLAIARGRATL